MTAPIKKLSLIEFADEFSRVNDEMQALSATKPRQPARKERAGCQSNL